MSSPLDRDARRRRRAQRAPASSSSRRQTANAEGAPISEAHVEDAARKRPLLYDKGGDEHYDFISAFIKSMRGSDPDAAVYYLAAMLEGGEDARFIARRMVDRSPPRTSATPTRRRCVVAVAAAQAVEHVGLPEARLNLAQAAIYLARAPKSNARRVAIWEARRDVREHGNVRPPAMLRDAHYGRREEARPRRGLHLPARRPGGFDVDYLPDELEDGGTIGPPATGEEADDGGRSTGDKAPEFDLEVTYRERVRLSDFRGRSNVLLVFHPFAFTAVCEEEARDLQENLESFRNAQTEIVFVSCDSAPTRQAWRKELGAEYTFASDFWSHGAVVEGLRRLQRGERRTAPRHVPHRQGRNVVIWSLVKIKDERRIEMVPDSLKALRQAE